MQSVNRRVFADVASNVGPQLAIEELEEYSLRSPDELDTPGATRGGRRISPAIAALVVAAATTLAACSPSQPDKDDRATSPACTITALQAFAPPDTTIDSVRSTASPVQHCRVDGHITVQAPGPYDVKFMLALPGSFNSRILMLSQGGAAGAIVEPDPSRLNEGFALASTDKGTAPRPEIGGLDFGWLADPAQHINWEYRANHVSAVATQQITRKYYGTSTLNRYISGCSGGGIAGWNSMRRYGTDDYDGAVVGSPPWISLTSLNIAWTRILGHLLGNPESWISPQQLQSAEEAIISRYDGADGAIDGTVQDDRLFTFDPAILEGIGFTPKQIELFSIITSGYDYLLTPEPVHFGGFSVSRPTGWSAALLGTTPPLWGPNDIGRPRYLTVLETSLRELTGRSDVDISTLDMRTRADQALFLPPELTPRYSLPDMRTTATSVPGMAEFAEGGGKVIHFYGVADNAVNYTNGQLAYEAMNKTSSAGGFPLDDWARSYFVPGALHCIPGSRDTGPDPYVIERQMLQPLIDWVENGKAPGGMTSADDRGVPLLCPYPQSARFLGGADRNVDDPKDWECRA